MHLRSRRQFVQGMGAAGLGLVAGCARSATPAEQPARLARIGILGPSTSPAGVRQALADLGYVDGRNLAIESREDYPEPGGYAASAAAELASLHPDVLVAANSSAVGALKRVTDTIPIVSTG